jgi:hypothetical protein
MQGMAPGQGLFAIYTIEIYKHDCNITMVCFEVLSCRSYFWQM